MTLSPRHLVVDGSNIATEGRNLPSLKQLDEAVRAILAERSFDSVTVIVDATFAHRIEDPEKEDYEAAVDAGEIITPPAGVVGRGDAFILMVAEKAQAAVLSNDSFQEFHGEHTWLFDDDRLIGGKPIEVVGWVFVARVPVRGPASRRAVREARDGQSSGRGTPSRSRRRSSTANHTTGPAPVPSKATPPPARNAEESDANPDQTDEQDEQRASKSSRRRHPSKKASGEAPADQGSRGNQRANASQSSASQSDELNAPLAFLGFVSSNSLGDEVEGVVDQFSSHGCYVRIDGALCYLPSKSMGDPAPTKARDVVAADQTVTVRVVSLDSERRGINVELVSVGAMAPSNEVHPSADPHESLVSTDDQMASAHLTRSESHVATKKATKKAPAKKTTAKKAVKKATTKKAVKAVKKAPAKKATAKKAV
ncbi:MAG: hypothetical protein ACI8TP_003127, partial [Acidimicrobiales bacterium]